MAVFGFLIAKDEADIIAQTLDSLLRFGGFDYIYFYDNGSSDGTLDIVRRCDDKRVVARHFERPFSDNVKFELVANEAAHLSDGDWYAILDADEFYCTPLEPLIKLAEMEEANCIEESCAQFYFTEVDENWDFDSAKPALEQRQHYLVNYGEPRVFRYRKNYRITADLVKARDAGLGLVSSSCMLPIQHFQFRSARQLEARVRNRLLNHQSSGNWGHVRSVRLKDYVVSSRYLHRYDGAIQQGLPLNLDLCRVRNNIAYTKSSLAWMRRHGHLTREQVDCLESSRSRRVFRRIFGAWGGRGWS